MSWLWCKQEAEDGLFISDLESSVLYLIDLQTPVLCWFCRLKLLSKTATSTPTANTNAYYKFKFEKELYVSLLK